MGMHLRVNKVSHLRIYFNSYEIYYFPEVPRLLYLCPDIVLQSSLFICYEHMNKISIQLCVLFTKKLV